jgi:arylsulfatase A-like enzyme
LYDSTIFILSADNGGILPGGYNWPYRGAEMISVLYFIDHWYCVFECEDDGFTKTGSGQTQLGKSPNESTVSALGQKATLWEGGARAVGFIHSALLPKVGFSYHGLVHVSDWTPTLYKIAGGGVIEGLDGAYYIYIYIYIYMQESTTLHGPRRALCSCIRCLAACLLTGL